MTMEKIRIPAMTTPTELERPYHPKRAHRKTRTGCRNCKARKVKCDEARPACRACSGRHETCVYMVAPTRPKTVSPPPSTNTALTISSRPATSAGMTVLQEPLFIPAGREELDLRLLWFYSTATYSSFSTGSMRQRNVDIVLKVNVVQHAFANPFLMDCVLGLSAMHANHLNLRHMDVSHSKELSYRARALETYRKAVEVADPATFPALLVCSLLLCGLSTHVFRGEEAKPLAILDWMILWRGIGTIVEVTKLPLLFRSGVASIIFRPDVDLDASSQHMPNYLLFMIASIKEGDPDFPLVPTYYSTLQYLGSLYLEVANGFSQMLLLRIVTFFTFLPREFIDAARDRRPPALVILAHYLVFMKLRVKTCWWMDGISDHEIPCICEFLGPEWAHLLGVPMAALQLSEHRDLARLLLDDQSWDPPVSMAEEPLTSACETELVVRAAVEEQEEVAEGYQRRAVHYGVC